VPSAPRLAIWGTFDVDNFGDHLFPRIFEHEMKRRLPSAEVHAFSPLGHLHPVPLAGGRVVEPLGAWSPERAAELARGYDLVAIGGGEIIHTLDDAYASYYGTSIGEARRLRPSAFFIDGPGPALEERCPVAWHSVGLPFDLEGEIAERVRSALERRAYVSVRDEISRERLVRAGVDREIAVVPDSALLVDRVVSEQQLERRLAYLRGIGSYPPSGRPLVVQGSRQLLPRVDDVARALTAALEEAGEVPILLLETGACHGDGEFADALEAVLPRRVHRMPESPTVEDVVAAIVQSRGFAGLSLHGSLVAFARGLPTAILGLAGGYSKLAGFAALAGREDALVRSPDELLPALRRVLAGDGAGGDVAGLSRRIDAHFDVLAELAERSAAQRSDGTGADVASRGEAMLGRAFEGRGRRLVQQRLRLADEIEALERTLREREERLAEVEAHAAARAEDAALATRRLAEVENAWSVATRRLAEVEAWAAATAEEHGRTKEELNRLQTSRLFRYTAPLRAAYAGARRLVS
jgi:polysaccharide pyruvyl transferase WcaK-like protein